MSLIFQDGEVYDAPRDHINDQPLTEHSKVVQIQGKGNDVPKDEYQDMLKHYYTNAFDDQTRPAIEGDEIDHIAGIEHQVTARDPQPHQLPIGPATIEPLFGYLLGERRVTYNLQRDFLH